LNLQVVKGDPQREVPKRKTVPWTKGSPWSRGDLIPRSQTLWSQDVKVLFPLDPSQPGASIGIVFQPQDSALGRSTVEIHLPIPTLVTSSSVTDRDPTLAVATSPSRLPSGLGSQRLGRGKSRPIDQKEVTLGRSQRRTRWSKGHKSDRLSG
jgi:hypothetical protein